MNLRTYGLVFMMMALMRYACLSVEPGLEDVPVVRTMSKTSNTSVEERHLSVV